MARPAGLEPATPGLEVPRKEATRGSTTLLPLISLTFGQAPDHPRQRRAATHCQSFVSRLSPRVRNVRSRDVSTSWFDHHEGCGETLTQFIDDVHNRLTQTASHSGGEADQHHACGLLSIRRSEQTEVLVSVRSTRASDRAKARTISSSAPGLICMTDETSWPTARRALTTAKSQLSSARNRTG
jgi:hypothetical protein